MKHLIPFLRTITIFRHLKVEQVRELVRTMQVKTFPSGAPVFHKGEKAEHMFVILSGKVKIYSRSSSKMRTTFAYLGPGDFFGEMALIDNEPRSATVIATEPLDLITIWRGDFLQILADNFSITRKMLSELSRRLRRASNRIESLATMDVYGRLARYFLDIAASQGKVLDNGYVAVVRPTHQSIANTIGTSRETVSRLIHDLMKQGLLISEGKTIYLRQEAIDQFKAEL